MSNVVIEVIVPINDEISDYKLVQSFPSTAKIWFWPERDSVRARLPAQTAAFVEDAAHLAIETNGHQILVTRSEAVIHRLRRLLAEGCRFTFRLHLVSNTETTTLEAGVDGSFMERPNGFLTFYDDELGAILKARAARRSTSEQS